MVIRRRIYNNLAAARHAKRRNRIAERLFRPEQTNVLQDGRIQIVWSNDPEITIPEISMTRTAFVNQLAKNSNVKLI